MINILITAFAILGMITALFFLFIGLAVSRSKDSTPESDLIDGIVRSNMSLVKLALNHGAQISTEAIKIAANLKNEKIISILIKERPEATALIKRHLIEDDRINRELVEGLFKESKKSNVAL